MIKAIPQVALLCHCTFHFFYPLLCELLVLFVRSLALRTQGLLELLAELAEIGSSSFFLLDLVLQIGVLKEE